MGNNELNNRVLKNVRSKIVVSSLEREEKMKITKRNKVISICTMLIVVISGGLFTVNATTDGKIAEEIKKAITINYDQSKYKVVTENQIENINGEEYVKYTMESLNGAEEFETLINKSEMDKQELDTQINVTTSETENETEAGIEMIISGKNK